MANNIDYLDGRIVSFDIATGDGKIRADEPDDDGDDRVHFNVINLRNAGVLKGLSNEQIAAAVDSGNFIAIKNIPVAFHEAEGEWEVPIFNAPVRHQTPAAILEERDARIATQRRSNSDPSADQPDLADDVYWPGAELARDKAAVNKRPAKKPKNRAPGGNDGLK